MSPTIVLRCPEIGGFRIHSFGGCIEITRDASSSIYNSLIDCKNKMSRAEVMWLSQQRAKYSKRMSDLCIVLFLWVFFLETWNYVHLALYKSIAYLLLKVRVEK